MLQKCSDDCAGSLKPQKAEQCQGARNATRHCILPYMSRSDYPPVDTTLRHPVSMTLCPQCRRDYPSHLFIDDLCPICALRNRNEMQGLPPDTPFSGENARLLHESAAEFDRRRVDSPPKCH
jgi:hypothetical protein